ncbi:response regulator transcription factor [Camelliibacillus cellulosilyticus]|uniref:Response regulator transcription factor n=2 Tax=Camelliibacillus cellulosilyticus TaxID=2174486 RepID=A0ABV9GP63_9BACL
MTMKIMIVEDDKKLADLLKAHIEKYGYDVLALEDFEDVASDFKKYNPHLVLLDVNLPKFDGYYWCRQIRKSSVCPILFISARSEQMDQVMALENGADDYITKPFHYEVVMAKIRSQLRRSYGEYAQQSDERILEQNGLTLYPERMEAILGDEKVLLTKKESVLLETLITQYPKVVSRDFLLEKLWDDENFVDENTLNVNVTRVRKKLKDLGIEDGIETIRGAGYRLKADWESGDEG